MDPAPSWIVWFSIGIPISTLTIVSTWAILTWSYEREFSYEKGAFELSEEDPELRHLAPRSKNNEPIVYIKPIPNPKNYFSFSQWFILIVSFLTIILWCFENLLHAYFGDMGVIALLPMIIFFGSGLLRKSDFDNFVSSTKQIWNRRLRTEKSFLKKHIAMVDCIFSDEWDSLREIGVIVGAVRRHGCGD